MVPDIVQPVDRLVKLPMAWDPESEDPSLGHDMSSTGGTLLRRQTYTSRLMPRTILAAPAVTQRQKRPRSPLSRAREQIGARRPRWRGTSCGQKQAGVGQRPHI